MFEKYYNFWQACKTFLITSETQIHWSESQKFYLKMQSYLEGYIFKYLKKKICQTKRKFNLQFFISYDNYDDIHIIA